MPVTMIRRHRHAAVAALAVSLALPAAAQDAQDVTGALATLETADGKPGGSVEFTQTPNGVILQVLVENVSPGMHAIHLHETGDCGSGFEAAGGHFAPGGHDHGFRSETGAHAGDLPNITVGVDGTGSAQYLNQRISLSDGDSVLLDDDGAAVIVHEQADTYNDEASAGSRVACGVIEARV